MEPLAATKEEVLIRNLGDGLVLRRATPADADRLSEFNGIIHSERGPDSPDLLVAAWTRDLLERPHPTFSPGDFTIVEDTRTGKIVSSLNLISQTWAYAGISFGVGRPELVGTLPEYRHRGLVRAQFDVVHAWSAQRGEMVQAITGIPYYYRLFGYEMGLALSGGRLGYGPHVPKLGEGQEEPYRLRPAVETDLALIGELYDLGRRRSLVSVVWDEALWRYELLGKSEKNVNRMELRIIESNGGEPVGFLAHPCINWGPKLVAQIYELKPGVSWAAVTPTVARYLMETGRTYAAAEDNKVPCEAFGFWMGDVNHPAYQVMHDSLPRVIKPYAFYLRMPDLPGFLAHIRPALEQRLAASAMAGHTGELKITFYRSGLLLGFEHGRLSKIEPWRPTPVGHSGDLAFPELTFLQALFGYRSLEEINYARPDCFWNNDHGFALANILFPRQPSDVMPVS